MRIRRYLLITSIVLVLSVVVGIKLYRDYHANKINAKAVFYVENGISQLARVNAKEIEIYTENGFEKFSINGIRLSSFFPGYEINQSNISKDRVLKWLGLIEDLGANVILLPYIQPTSFYDAVYEHNLNSDKPLYLIHEISLNTKILGNTYNAFDKEFMAEIKKELKTTVDVVHGKSLQLSDNRHKGLYLKDISKFNLGYIIGTNTIPELIVLTNAKHPELVSYSGKYFSIHNGSAFEVFMAQMLEYVKNYELSAYNQNSILSYLTTIETDPFSYENESTLTKNASLDLNKIKSTNNDLFASIVAHPNDSDFLDYEDGLILTEEDNFYSVYLKKIVDYFQYPTIITEVGMSSSRGKSKVNLSKGYDRGNYEETEQGELIVELLRIIEDSGASGSFIDSFQDNWGRISTFNLKKVISKNTSTYWYDAQASDEAFGLMAFEVENKNKRIVLDGNVDEWKNIPRVINDDNLELKVTMDSGYLYLLVGAKDWNFNEKQIFIGIDTVPNIGSSIDDETNTVMNVNAEFIIELTGYNTSRIITNERYNVFNYLYKYNEYVLDKQSTIPEVNSKDFSAIYLLNRKQFFIKTTSQIESTIYYETGKLVHGSVDKNADNYNSLADFCKDADYMEIRIPWTMLNFKDPIQKKVLGDFYKIGVDDEIKINNIRFSLTSKQNNESEVSKAGRYQLQSLNNLNYGERLKESYYILQKYWGENL